MDVEDPYAVDAIDDRPPPGRLSPAEASEAFERRVYELSKPGVFNSGEQPLAWNGRGDPRLFRELAISVLGNDKVSLDERIERFRNWFTQNIGIGSYFGRESSRTNVLRYTYLNPERQRRERLVVLSDIETAIVGRGYGQGFVRTLQRAMCLARDVPVLLVPRVTRSFVAHIGRDFGFRLIVSRWERPGAAQAVDPTNLLTGLRDAARSSPELVGEINAALRPYLDPLATPREFELMATLTSHATDQQPIADICDRLLATDLVRALHSANPWGSQARNTVMDYDPARPARLTSFPLSSRQPVRWQTEVSMVWLTPAHRIRCLVAMRRPTRTPFRHLNPDDIALLESLQRYCAAWVPGTDNWTLIDDDDDDDWRVAIDPVWHDSPLVRVRSEGNRLHVRLAQAASPHDIAFIHAAIWVLIAMGRLCRPGAPHSPGIDIEGSPGPRLRSSNSVRRDSLHRRGSWRSVAGLQPRRALWLDPRASRIL